MSIIILIVILINLVLNIYFMFFKIDKIHQVSGITSWPKIENKKTKNKIIVNDDKKIWIKENIN